MADGLMQVEDITATIMGRLYNAILFNDSDHSMDEVEYQIIQAIHCDLGRAHAIMMSAHRSGQAVVISGGRERCEHVCSVLERISLRTAIEEAI